MESGMKKRRDRASIKALTSRSWNTKAHHSSTKAMGHKAPNVNSLDGGVHSILRESGTGSPSPKPALAFGRIEGTPLSASSASEKAHLARGEIGSEKRDISML